MTRTLRYGIIGCGMMGREHLANIALLPGTGVAAIYEPDAAMRARAAALAPDARLAESVADLLADPGVDLLLIASPNHLHVAQLEAALAARPRPVLLEKPAFTRPSDAARLAAMQDAPVWVAMEYRYMPAISHLLGAAEAATGGPRMLSIREHRFPFLPKVGAWNRFNATSGGTFVEKCCHFFDLMRLVAGGDRPRRVMASAGQAVNHRDEIHDGARPDIWDHGYVIVEFEGGLRAMLDLCMFAEGARFQEEIVATGPLGRIEARVPGPTRFWPEALGAPPLAEVIESPRAPRGERLRQFAVDPALLAAGDHNGATFHQHRRFLAAARGEGPIEVSLTDGWWAAAIGMAAQESAATGRAVDLADLGYLPR